jgi:putative ABC transport system substrate-binding protein
MVYAPDYVEAARRAAAIAARIMKGESAMNIPFQRISKFDFIVNKKAAKDFNITIPQDIIDKASIVLDENDQTID